LVAETLVVSAVAPDPLIHFTEISNRMSRHDKAARDLREHAEKRQIREYFDLKRDGVVVEVGANDPTALTSQSLHLENELGWQAVLIEPNPDLAQRARDERPRAKVFEFACVSSDDIGELSFYIPVTTTGEIHSHASIEKNIDDQQYAEHRVLKVRSKTLNSILDESGIQQIDLLSIDVEGAEMEVLKGLDLSKHRPRLILLEDKHVFLNKHRLLKRNGYSLAFRTGQNCWYIPAGGRRPEQTFGQKFSIFRRLYFSIWLKKAKLAVKKRSLKPFASL
jgi:FkbM family methyltransferase